MQISSHFHNYCWEENKVKNWREGHKIRQICTPLLFMPIISNRWLCSKIKEVSEKQGWSGFPSSLKPVLYNARCFKYISPFETLFFKCYFSYTNIFSPRIAEFWRNESREQHAYRGLNIYLKKIKNLYNSFNTS